MNRSPKSHVPGPRPDRVRSPRLLGNLAAALALAALGGVTACGSGGVGSPTVSGVVEAPNGEIAGAPAPSLFARLAEFVLAEARAMTGLEPVGRGIGVKFQRIDGEGKVTETLVTVQTAADGTYINDLASDEVPSSSLILAVGDTTATRMRAFFSGSSVDIDPPSEATVRLVLDSGYPLSNFSPGGLQSISEAVDQATADIDAGDSIEEANDAAEEAAAEDPEVQAAIVAAGAD
jgi:hypothetical protein